MCGILAVIKHLQSTKPIPNTEDIIDSGKILSRRGPDNMRVKTHNDSCFIFYRLCIMDTSDDGNQPFDSDIIMMCNGEIYNYIELIKKYDLKCNSQSDCEVILRLYEKFKDFNKVVSLLDGVFAIVLVDGSNCYFTRDNVGVRPLFFNIMDGNIGVCSLVQPLLKFDKNVHPVDPGSVLHFDLSQNYLLPNISVLHKQPTQLLNIDVPTAIAEVEHLISRAVGKRVDSHRPFGCLLSGGLDSSIVAALLCKILGPKNVRTYSIGMDGSTDLKYAKIMAEYLGTIHTEVNFTEEEGLNTIPEVIKNIESYDITTIRASTPMYLISKYISEKTDDIVIFSGEGMDELFCGYLYFHNAPSDKHLEDESKRLVEELHWYDVLRADRTVSAHGLEFREPCLDKDLCQFALSLPGAVKKPINGIEKYIIRKAFESILPHEICWRRKEGFSDGNSSIERSWKDVIEEYAKTIISSDELGDYVSYEQAWYHKLFNEYFPTYDLDLPTWMPKWSGNLTDPSGRLIKAFDETMKIDNE